MQKLLAVSIGFDVNKYAFQTKATFDALEGFYRLDDFTGGLRELILQRDLSLITIQELTVKDDFSLTVDNTYSYGVRVNEDNQYEFAQFFDDVKSDVIVLYETYNGAVDAMVDEFIEIANQLKAKYEKRSFLKVVK